MKKLIAILFALIGAAGVYISLQGIAFLSSPAHSEHNEVIVDVPSGRSFNSVASELAERGVITDTLKFRLLAKFMYPSAHVRMGEYRLATDMRPRQVLETITSGQSITYPTTIPEGHNIYEIRAQLNTMWAGFGDEFFKMATDPAVVKALLGFEATSLEGYLFPETYTLTKYTKAETLLRQMVEFFNTNLAQVNENAKIQMSAREQVVLASVIEKETGAAEERSMISSVFHNRLKKRMRLQSDPTILYGILVETSALKANITKSDILRPTPYNTYTVAALPVGPISNPGRDALWAAVNPVDSEYLYFVSRNDGTHVFSVSYKDHENAVRKFQLDRTMREGKSWRNKKN